MAVRLKSRQLQIPGGMKFYQPETKWSPPAFASFDTIVNSLIQHRQGNPFLVQKHGWSTDRAAVEAEVDQFNARICQQMNWTDYFVTDGGASPPVPFSQPPHQRPLSQLGRNAVAGVETIGEMFGREGPHKDQALAERRAQTCLDCPKHDQGDWTAYFTMAAANTIRTVLQWLKGQHLQTSRDSSLRVCTACSCPMRLKIWSRVQHVRAHIPAESKAQLDPKCWILLEP